MKKTPHYIITLKNELIEHFDAKIEKEVTAKIGSLAAMTAGEFKKVYKKFDEIEEKMVTKEDLREHEIATKKDFEKIHSLIGKYEIRAENIENILLQDHKPRLSDLEKEVFA